MQTDKARFVRITRLFLLMAAIQTARAVMVQALSLCIQPTTFTRKCMDISAMLLIGAVLLFIAWKKHIDLSFLPLLKNYKEKLIYFSVLLINISLIVASLYLNVYNREPVPEAAVNILSSLIMIPVFEELIFRGFIWNSVKLDFKSEWAVLFITTALFAVWHLGYADTILFTMKQNRVSGNIAVILAMKAATGAAFGVVTGFVRLKAKSCSASALVHSMLNVFGR